MDRRDFLKAGLTIGLGSFAVINMPKFLGLRRRLVTPRWDTAFVGTKPFDFTAYNAANIFGMSLRHADGSADFYYEHPISLVLGYKVGVAFERGEACIVINGRIVRSHELAEKELTDPLMQINLT